MVDGVLHSQPCVEEDSWRRRRREKGGNEKEPEEEECDLFTSCPGLDGTRLVARLLPQSTTATHPPLSDTTKMMMDWSHSAEMTF